MTLPSSQITVQHSQLGSSLVSHCSLFNAFQKPPFLAHTANGQHYRMAVLNLFAAIVFFWNTEHLGIAVATRMKEGQDCPGALLSPLGWAHILLTGENSDLKPLAYYFAPTRRLPRLR